MRTPINILSGVLRIFFRLLYHELAWTYDAVAWVVSLGRWTQWTQAVLPQLQGKRLLEVGFGTGRLQAIMWKLGYAPVGLDASWQMCRISARHLASMNISTSEGEPPGKLVNSRTQELPFANQSFDQIVCTFPPDFILQTETLAEYFRVLMLEGTVTILPLAWIEGKGLLERMAAWVFYITGEAPSRTPALESTFREALQQAGFEVTLEYIQQQSSKLMLVIGRKSCYGEIL